MARKAAYRSECEYVGMVRGEPTFYFFEPGYGEFHNFISNIKAKADVNDVIALINALKIRSKHENN